MAAVLQTSPTYFAHMFRDLADKIEAGTIEIQAVVSSSDPYEGQSELSYRTWIPNPFCSMEITYRRLADPLRPSIVPDHIASGEIVTAAHFNQLVGASLITSKVTIDTAEYPMQDSDPSLDLFIKRVLMEMGHSGTYETHRMETRPGKAPMLIVQGVA